MSDSDKNRKKKLPAGSSAVLKKVLRVIGRHELLIGFSILFATGSVIMQLYVPMLFGDAIDRIKDKGMVDFALIGIYLTKILILVAASSVIVWLMSLINNRLAFKTVQDIRSKAIRQLQDLPLSYLDRCSTGDVVQRVIADTDQLADGLLLGFNQLFSGVVTIIVTLVFMFSKNVIITLMVLVMTPVSFLVARFIASRSYKMFGKQTKTRGRQTALINEVISNQKVVKAFGCEDRVSGKFREVNEELKGYSQSAVFFSSLTNPSTRAVNNVIYALVALVGAYSIMSADPVGGGLTVGGLTVLLAYANQYMKPFNDISSVITELQNALACANRVFEFIEAEPQVKEADVLMKPAEGLVDIDHVDFSYVKEKPLIENFTFTAKPGTTTAIVGPTGCGKTTFINLLMRFYDVDKGSITVDGQEVREVTRHSLRSNYGMVLQETWLKAGTIRENIAFGKPDATDEEIIQAAKDSHCWEFIRRMPGRLDCVVRDDSLSQGQKQLLCIARVMLCRPPMLILDEATSSIDTRTELQIQEAFAKLMKGRTSFIVAHRLSTIHNADNIIVMQAGKILEQGDHDSLMKKGGFYMNLYNSQFAGVE
ncbi:MAG: ABC transporter ATP-binding protein/permease [Lachnospiraceae bacterium]|nr:ABC transporter ATP-binding protein/permease [Lachnospiraceae bacterium]